MDQGRQVGHHFLVVHVSAGLLLYGIVVGWLRIPYQSNTPACAGPNDYGPLLASHLHSLQHTLLRRHNTLDADIVCGVPAHTELGAHAGKIFYTLEGYDYKVTPK